MTATPKQDDSIDTYAFFAAENLDDEGQPRPIYEYSLGRGIDDGYLATYKVLKVSTTIDDGIVIEDEVERGAELLVPEGTTPRDFYEMREFERKITVPDRTRVLCEHLAGVLRTYGALDKTMVFCVTMEHAALVRSFMQDLLGPETGKTLYAARIVSEERDAKELLEQFQLASSTEPVVVTTVDLLSTGVNAPSVRNIVFMKPIGSVTTFKQIIGRGSRLDALTGKTFFRVIDYTNASRLFDEWDLPTSPTVTVPTEGANTLSGCVEEVESGTPIAGAAVSVRVQSKLIAEVLSDEDGTFNINGLPGAVVDVFGSATGYTRKHLRVDIASEEADDLIIALPKPSKGDTRLTISGVDVSISEEIELDLGQGNVLAPAEFLSRASDTIHERVSSESELRAMWQTHSTRSDLEEFLAVRQITPELLGLVLGRSDLDGYDLFASVAFDAAPVSRDARAAAALQRLETRYSDLPPAFIEAVVDKFRIGGVAEVSTSELFNLAPFPATWGGVMGVATLLGSTEKVGEFLESVQKMLFDGFDS